MSTDQCPLDFDRLAKSLKLRPGGVRKTVELLDSGNTIPFITRYRGDQTGGLDEQEIEAIRDRVRQIRAIEERRQTILRSLEGQKKLSDELRKQIQTAGTLKRLDDLYLPYKPKKQSLAARAVGQGLAPFAEEILAGSCDDLQQRAAEFINTDAEEEDKRVPDAAAAITGAGHILAERFSENADFRRDTRKLYYKTGAIVCSKVESIAEKKALPFKDYFSYREPLGKTPPHRILAINRGERGKVLKVTIESDEAQITTLATERFAPADHKHHAFLIDAVSDMLKRLLLPSLEREARRELTDQAEAHSLQVFAKNLRQLLLQPPLAGKRILAVDPGYKNGCKLGVIDERGNVLHVGVVHIVGGDEKIAEARKELIRLAEEHQVNLFVIGNGKACRPTEELVAGILSKEFADRGLYYVIANEAGASVYSTSTIGREELPDYDAALRSAISIGRRLQDPLSELVKIDPASIGVGLYQHDARAKSMKETLDGVVQSCVSFVGVDLNSASAALLRHVSGMNQLTARRVVEHRQEQGAFKTRQQLLEVNGFGQAAFTQAAGFLKIIDGEEPLDGAWVHPEDYEVARRLLAACDLTTADLGKPEIAEKLQAAAQDRDALASQLEVGRHALDQLIEALSRPGRDLREDSPPPLFRSDVVRIEDLTEGMQLQGKVLNVVDFGAFVDVGLSDSGLIHVSQMSINYIKDPHEVVSVGDQVRVWVTSIDMQRRRVALTMIDPSIERPPRPSRRRSRPKKDSAAKAKQGQEQSTAASGSDSGNRSGSKKSQGRPPRKPRHKQDRRPAKPVGPRVFEKRAAGPPPKITKEMKEGAEAMRSFGDLLQFAKEKNKDKPADQ